MNVGGVGAGPSAGGAGCQDQIVDTEPVYEPLDVVLVADNAFNMADPNTALETSLGGFAQLIDGAGVDARFVVLSDHGPDPSQLCVPPPLGGSSNCNAPPVEVTGRFYPFDIEIQFSNALCRMLETVYGTMGGGQADQNGYYPGGWASLLRPQAQHAIVVYTFSGVSCIHDGTQYFDQGQSAQGQTVALDWDKEILSLAPGVLGSQADRRYVFHSIVGVPPKADLFAPYGPFEPIEVTQCGGTFGPGTGYQWLSKGTEGLRFPSCQYSGVSNMLATLATKLVDDATDRCRLQLPADIVDVGELAIAYTPNAGQPELWFEVSDESTCGALDDAFYVDAQLQVHLCPDACMALEASQGTTQVQRICPIP